MPQLIYLVLTFLGLGVALAQHGKPKEGHHSFWTSLFGGGICWVCLYYGGFFDVLLKGI